MKVNLKTKSHVKGYALRGVGLRKQVGVVRACARSVPERPIAFACPRNLRSLHSVM